jgi:hypothetical protein
LLFDDTTGTAASSRSSTSSLPQLPNPNNSFALRFAS